MLQSPHDPHELVAGPVSNLSVLDRVECALVKTALGGVDESFVKVGDRAVAVEVGSIAVRVVCSAGAVCVAGGGGVEESPKLFGVTVSCGAYALNVVHGREESPKLYESRFMAGEVVDLVRNALG